MNFSTEDLRGVLAILSKTDPQSYRNAKKLLSEFVTEIQKAKPCLESISYDASYSRQTVSAKNTVDTCQAYLKIIAAFYSVSVNLPEEFKTPQYPISTIGLCPRDISVSEMPGIKIKPENRLPVTIPKVTISSQTKTIPKTKAIPVHGTPCIIAGCTRPRVNGFDFCQKHKELSISYRESNSKCLYPSCHAKRYAGTLYCRYHYNQEKYLSK